MSGRRQTHPRLFRLTFSKRLAKILLIFIGVIMAFLPSLSARVQSQPSVNTPQPEIISPTPVTVTVTDNPSPIRIDPGLLSAQSVPQIPTRIIIPAVNIDLPVIEARVVGGTWELSDTSASHGAGSAYPGQPGNIVIFAHAREGLFLPLREIKSGQFIYLLTAGKSFRYLINQRQEVSPSQVQTISPTTSETLTLFTCSGFLDSQRLIVQAYPSL